MVRFTIRMICLGAMFVALSDCAAKPPAPAPAPQAVLPRLGTLVALRPVGSDLSRRSVLSALGVADAAGAVVECIVLADDGGTLSVVEPDPGGLREGLRVAVLQGRQPLAATRIIAAAR